jgi:hypothetical protein
VASALHAGGQGVLELRVGEPAQGPLDADPGEVEHAGQRAHPEGRPRRPHRRLHARPIADVERLVADGAEPPQAGQRLQTRRPRPRRLVLAGRRLLGHVQGEDPGVVLLEEPRRDGAPRLRETAGDHVEGPRSDRELPEGEGLEVDGGEAGSQARPLPMDDLAADAGRELVDDRLGVEGLADVDVKDLQLARRRADEAGDRVAPAEGSRVAVAGARGDDGEGGSGPGPVARQQGAEPGEGGAKGQPVVLVARSGQVEPRGVDDGVDPRAVLPQVGQEQREVARIPRVHAVAGRAPADEGLLGDGAEDVGAPALEGGLERGRPFAVRAVQHDATQRSGALPGRRRGELRRVEPPGHPATPTEEAVDAELVLEVGAGLVARLQGLPVELADAGARDLVPQQGEHVRGREAVLLVHRLPNGLEQARQGVVAEVPVLRAEEQHEALGAVLVADAEGAGEGRGDAVDLLRGRLEGPARVLHPVDDDDVLGPAGDEEGATPDAPEIAGAEPAVVVEVLAVRRRLPRAEVAAEDARAAHLQLADLALVDDLPPLVDDAELAAGDGAAEAHVDVGVRRRLEEEVVRVGDPGAELAHPEGRPHRVGGEAEGRQDGQEASCRAGHHRLAGVDQIAEAAKVEVAILEPALRLRDEGVAEVGGPADRRAEALAALEPAEGIGEDPLRGDVDLAAAGDDVVDADGDAAPDVVEGHPVEGDVPLGLLPSLVAAEGLGEEVAVAQRHHLGAPGAPARLEVEGDVLRVRRGRRADGGVALEELLDGQDLDVVVRSEARREGVDLRRAGDDHRSAQGLAGMADAVELRVVLLVVRGRGARQERALGEDGAPEGRKEPAAGRELTDDGRALGDAPASQASGHSPGPFRQRRVVLEQLPVFVEVGHGARREAGRRSVEGLGEGRRCVVGLLEGRAPEVRRSGADRSRRHGQGRGRGRRPPQLRRQDPVDRLLAQRFELLRGDVGVPHPLDGEERRGGRASVPGRARREGVEGVGVHRPVGAARQVGDQLEVVVDALEERVEATRRDVARDGEAAAVRVREDGVEEGPALGHGTGAPIAGPGAGRSARRRPRRTGRRPAG